MILVVAFEWNVLNLLKHNSEYYNNVYLNKSHYPRQLQKHTSICIHTRTHIMFSLFLFSLVFQLDLIYSPIFLIQFNAFLKMPFK